MLNENDVCDLQVRIFLRNASCSTMLLCTAKDHWDSRTFSRGSTKFSLNNVQISTRISSSLEVAKYVWFILKEMGVPDISPLAKIRSMKFGQLDVENLISKGEDDSGLPIYIIKPSEIAKLNLSNPTISPNIARYPRKTTIIKEQRDGTRLHEIISPWASVNNTHFHVGEPVKVTSNALYSWCNNSIL